MISRRTVMNKKVKFDLRFNDVKHAIVEVSAAIKNCPLTDEALAILISSASGSKGVTTNQAFEVIRQLQRLEAKYIKQ